MSEQMLFETADHEDSLFAGLDVADPWALAAQSGVTLPEIPLDALGGALGGAGESEEDRLPEVTDEDYAPEEWFFFDAIRRHIRAACNKSSSPAIYRTAADWLLTLDVTDHDGFRLDLCCGMLNCRPAVIQARVQHQFYALGRNFESPLDGWKMRFPRSLKLDIENTLSPGLPVKFAELVWQWPGIRADILQNRLESSEFSNILRAMEAEGYIALRNGYVYFITRNFDYMTLRERRMFRWSSVILGEE